MIPPFIFALSLETRMILLVIMIIMIVILYLAYCYWHHRMSIKIGE